MSEVILEMKHITKAFSGVKALDDVNLQVKKGEIHALCGENGAGKSTLMNVLSAYILMVHTRETLFTKARPVSSTRSRTVRIRELLLFIRNLR